MNVIEGLPQQSSNNWHVQYSASWAGLYQHEIMLEKA